MRRVLFVCVENACRSQMAEAFFNSMCKKAVAISAGTRPAPRVNPLAVQVMREIGIDISNAKPKPLTPEMLRSASRVITMGCAVGNLCPGAIVEAEDWGIEDPAGKSVEKFREVRDIIRDRVKRLVEELC
ncbi:MAG: arsenate reductase ArsC [Candidatus Hadarchaeales archaeon]